MMSSGKLSDQFIPLTWLGTARSGLEVYLREEGPMKFFKYKGSDMDRRNANMFLKAVFPGKYIQGEGLLDQLAHWVQFVWEKRFDISIPYRERQKSLPSTP